MTIEVVVKTNSKESKVVIKGNVYYVYTKSPAREGKANKEVLKLLSKYFDLPKSYFFIKQGFKYRRKIIQIKE